MNVLFVGDVTGPEATDRVTERLPSLRREHDLDLVIVNADNVAVTGPHPFGGSGMTVELVERLLDGGVDVVTSGTHALDGPESLRALNLPGVIRPDNLPPGTPGRGTASLEVAGEVFTVVNLVDAPEFMPSASPVLEAWRRTERRGAVIVHLVGSSHTARLFAHAVDGEAAAVLGTLAHEATLHHYLLPGGTALVPDVGMAGPFGGIGGFDPERIVAGFEGTDTDTLPPYGLLEGPMIFDAVLLRLESGRCLGLERLDPGVIEGER
jgi:calcineurin-like phosphoesterase